jgi:predicted chitinase
MRAPTKEALIVCINWWEGNVPDGVMTNPVKVRAEVNGGDLGLKDTMRITALANRAMMA